MGFQVIVRFRVGGKAIYTNYVGIARNWPKGIEHIQDHVTETALASRWRFGFFISSDNLLLTCPHSCKWDKKGALSS